MHNAALAFLRQRGKRVPPAWVLTGILLLGILIRIPLSFDRGYEFDVQTNQRWARNAVEVGIVRSYTEQPDGTMLPNYPPLSMIIFAAVGYAEKVVAPGQELTAPIPYLLIKLPAIIADLLTALCLFFVLAAWKGRRMGYVGALLYVLHPVVFFDSTIWGQTDPLYTLFLTAALLALLRKWPVAAGALVAAAFLTKAQSVALFPLLLVLFTRDLRTLLRTFFGGCIVVLAVFLPFLIAGQVKPVINVYLHSVGYYSALSSNAYNLWWSLFGDSAGTVHDTDILLGIASYRTVGFVLFFAAVAAVLLPLWSRLRSPKLAEALPAVFLAAGCSAYAFFLFNTQMHERYLFPFLALGLPIAFLHWRALGWYVAGSMLFFWNLLGVLPYTMVDRNLFAAFPSLDVFIATLHLVVFVGFALLLRDLHPTVPPFLRRF